ncbi:hypothetical protein ATCC90586_004570 [Pythium insidiosum]|nr:hypothetical protein ATCC90586_004570 [Pythium insidiosum]
MGDVVATSDLHAIQRRKLWPTAEDAIDVDEDTTHLLKIDATRPEEELSGFGSRADATATFSKSKPHASARPHRKNRTSNAGDTTTSARDGQAEPGNTRPKVLFLDGLRGLAAMLVVTQHAGIMGDRNLGACAVDTFFVLSAFLLTMLFERQVQQLLSRQASSRSWLIALTDYMVKRFLRVYPLFVIVALVLWHMSVPQRVKLFKVKRAESYNLFKVLTFDEWFRPHVFWTLPLEITYYFLLPMLVVGMVRLRHRWWLPVGPLYVWIIYRGLYTYRTSHQSFGPHFPTFVAGSLAAIIYARAKDYIEHHRFEWQLPHQVALRCVEYATLGTLLSVAFNGLLFTWVHPSPAPKGGGFQFVSVHVTIVILCEMLLPGPVSRFLEWGVLRYAGKISYSIYLLHSFVVYSDFISKQSYYDRFFAIAGTIGVLCTATFYLVEYPSQRLAMKIGQRLKQIESGGTTATEPPRLATDTTSRYTP